MKRSKFFWLASMLLAGILLATAIVFRVIDGPGQDRQSRQPVTLQVSVARVERRAMPLSISAVGQVEPEHSVQIRPQVAGILKHVYFQEGQQVHANQRLFEIDPAPYKAKLAAAKAAWENSRTQAARLAPLTKKDYATAQEYDNARASADQALATYEQAKIDLSYTDIRAPISGRTGNLAVKAGNLIAPSDSAPLVTINQINPILVRFSIPQQQLDTVRHYQSVNGLSIFITHEDGSGLLDKGKLVFIDNTVDTTTGTVMLKARMPNAREQLWPGQFVGVHVELTVQPNAVVIPDSAVQVGQDGNYVYQVIGDKVRVQPIIVDRQVGRFAVIRKGLSGGETVVMRVPRDLRPGMSVIQVKPAQNSPTSTAPGNGGTTP